MGGFSIKDIKITSKEEKKMPQLLTGEYTMGLPKDSAITKNAEIEGEEYVKYPEGDIQKAIGPSHENGGIDMAIPEGTEVISKTTKLTKEDVKKIKSLYDIEVSTKDSYASAIDKYTKSIGLKKLNDEQADIIEQLKKQMERKDINKDTKSINTDYLSNKIYDTEAKKAPLESKRKEFFDLTFKLQEDKKPKSESANETFKYGGISGEAFKAMCEKHGLTEAEGREMLGESKSFGDGGKMFKTFEENIARYKADWTEQEFNSALAEQLRSGNLTEEGKSQLKNMWVATPKNPSAVPTEIKAWDDLTGDELANAKKEWNNNPEAYAAYKLAEKKLSDPTFQDAYYEKFKEVAGDDNYYRTKNKDTFKQDLLGLDKQTAINELLSFEKRNAQLKAFGYTPENAEQAPAKGYTVNQKALDIINKSNGVLKPEDFNKGYRGQAGYLAYTELLNKDSGKGKVYKASATGAGGEPFGGGTISAIDNSNTNTTLSQNLSVVEDTPPITETKTTTPPATDTGKTITDEGIQIPKKRYPQMFFHPDESVLPPESQTPETLIQNRFQRIDPVRIGIENNLQAINKSQQFATGQLDALPPSQRAASLATILGATQEAENQAIFGANTQNANNIVAAEQFNIGQSDRENVAQGQNMLSFEQRTLKAKAQTDLDLRNYLNYNHGVAMQNYAQDQRANLMNSLFKDYQMDYNFNVQYDPEIENKIQSQDDAIAYLRALQGQAPVTTTDAEDLTTKNNG